MQVEKAQMLPAVSIYINHTRGAFNRLCLLKVKEEAILILHINQLVQIL